MKSWDKVVFGIDTPPAAQIPHLFAHAANTSSTPKFNFNKSNNTNSSESFRDKGPSKWRSGGRFEKKDNNSSSSSPSKYNNQDRFNKSGNYNNNYNTNDIDAKNPDGTPKYKAVLLCGPPGLGKTTLAHVLARHAGYNPVEINARYSLYFLQIVLTNDDFSDDRKEEVFKQKLYAAVGMQSVMGDKKPNCLIIDEIDGVEGREANSAIEVLVKLLTAERKNGKKNDGGEDEKDDEKKDAEDDGTILS